jgi:GTP-binding protein
VDAPSDAAVGVDPATLPVSAVTGEGLEPLFERLGLLAKEGEDLSPERAPYVVLRPGRPRFTIDREDDGGWRVAGRGVERWVMETDMDDDRQIERLQRRLIREGVERRLVSLGAREGQEVRIRDLTFEFLPDRTPGEPAPETESEEA